LEGFLIGSLFAFEAEEEEEEGLVFLLL